MRVDQDGGAGDEDAAPTRAGRSGQQVQQVTLEMTYRVLACGT